MTILIANIGTSDLAVKVSEDSKYYLPIGFQREEPNLKYDGLEKDEAELWEKRNDHVAKSLCKELDVKVIEEIKKDYTNLKFSFRELTKKLLTAYQKNPKTWEQRLCPGRIGGVLQSAMEEYQVKDAWIFVTDQEDPRGQDKDSVYLFEILKLWVEQKKWQLTLHGHFLEETKRANNEDEMVEEYYKFFCNKLCNNKEIKSGELILVSIKGGTWQMQTAMKVQTISSGLKHLFLDPQLSVKQILAGEFSDCQPSSYWQYRRSQKYQIVELLLKKRWDFDGAREVLKDWKNTLEFLRGKCWEEEEKSKLDDNKKVVDRAIGALDMAVCYLNFDEAGAKTAFEQLRKPKELKQIVNGYDKLLNLYTTCRIFWNLEQIANFLPRLGSFCEETLHQIFREFNGEQYFDRRNHPHDWWLYKVRVEEKEELFNLFCETEGETNRYFDNSWGNNDKYYKFQGRKSKRNFAEALLAYENGSLPPTWQALNISLKKLDYWVDKRNQIIHSADGVSKKTMQEVLAADRKLKKSKALDTCKPKELEEIIAEMTNISRQTYALFGKSSSELLKFFGKDEPDYYIYKEIADWAIDRLMTDGLK